MKKQVTGYILIGGESSRMGLPKGNLKIMGQKFIKHILTALVPSCEKIIMVGDKSYYDHSEMERIPDINKNQGPISGIYSALVHSTTKWNFIFSCDIPTLTNKHVEKLLPKENSDSLPRILKDKNGLHPLIGIYPKSATAVVKNQIEKGDFKLLNLLQETGFKTIEIKDENEILNINSQLDYKKLQNEFEN